VSSPSLGGASPTSRRSETSRALLGDAVRYWELRRLPYNLALAGLVSAWVVLTWPHFRAALTLSSLLKLLILAALANLCYCAAYVVELMAQQSSFAATWRHRRWAVWLLGTLLALLVAHYWIGDEIYPSVGAG
jgi:hypothetical protein